MNTPCIVDRDINRYLRQLDEEDARDSRVQELLEEHRRSLTEDRPGFSLITEALYADEIGYPLDEALFELFVAWRRRKGVLKAVKALVTLLEDKAARMARDWATVEQTRETASTREPDDDIPW